jgi:uncharacterized protein
MTVETARRADTLEPEIRALLLELKARLQRRFGERFVGLWLFGSRARGDHDPDSDVDVAVVLRQRLPHPFATTREILRETYDLLLERGYDIQPWPLEEGSLEDPDAHPYPMISRSVLREGVAI